MKNNFMKKPNQTLINVLTFIVIIVLAGLAYFFYFKYSKTQAILQNPTIATKEEIKNITSKISRYMELPDEQPTIATVIDKSKLKNQPFFKKAENGDKVIIYVKSLKAILYRPSTGKVIEFSIIAIPPQTVNIALYNGTNIASLTKNVQKDLENNVSGIKVLSRDNAKKTNYEKTVVIDLSETRAAEASQLANFLNGEIATKLPSGEVRPSAVNGVNADILVIIGKNYRGFNLPTTSSSPTLKP
jgi:hypothetical protein